MATANRYANPDQVQFCLLHISLYLDKCLTSSTIWFLLSCQNWSMKYDKYGLLDRPCSIPVHKFSKPVANIQDMHMSIHTGIFPSNTLIKLNWIEQNSIGNASFGTPSEIPEKEYSIPEKGYAQAQ